ncbi:MAG TPA: spore germination protein GerW family protein [Polyangiaceae bacterium]|nr:spore germination protein GerW family protein [Polyangiaceae bacterium]
MSKTPISELVSSLLSGVHGISRSETIIGAPQQAGDATVIPVHRLKIAFGAATASAGAHGDTLGGESDGQGAGGAVELEPVAAIAVGKDGHAHLLTVEGTDSQGAWSALLQEVPELLTRLAGSLGDRLRGELSPHVASAVASTDSPRELTPSEK